MPRVIWDEVGKRSFETGIDRGMLYLPSIPGVAWNGLVSVSESPIGGTAKEFYIDGTKFTGNSSLEEYSATIEAFSSPAEFAPCAGWAKLLPGLYVANQPRQSFGFSYRTLLGNDLLGTDFGYKIHLVYNAVAKTSDVTRQTMTDSSEVRPYSWAITAVPESYEGTKPTSHFVIDSTKTDPGLLAHIERILYGTDSDDPRLLTVNELIFMLRNRMYLSSDITFKKIMASGLITALSSGASHISLKKIEVLGSVAVGLAIPSRATVSVNLKKMTASGTGTGKSIADISVTLKKMTVSGSAIGRSVGIGSVVISNMNVYGSIVAGSIHKFVSAYAPSGQSQRSVSVSEATQEGDTLVVACPTNSNTSYATQLTDSKGNVYTLDRSSYTTSPSLVIFRSPGATGGSGGGKTAALTTSDTLTVTLSLTSGALAVLGAVLPADWIHGYDVIPGSISTATSGTVSASATPIEDRDVALLLTTHAAGGGTPTINSPFTSLGVQQAGTYEYATIAYHILGYQTNGVEQTGTETIVSAGWKAILYLFKRREHSTFSANILLKKMIVSGTGMGSSAASGGALLKKITVSGSGSVGAPFKFANGYGPYGTTSRDIPVTAATSTGSTLLVICSTNSITGYATSLTDTKGNVYILDRSIYTSPTPTEVTFRAPGSTGGPDGGPTVALATSDHLTVGLSSIIGELAVIGISLPSYLVSDYDVIPPSISAGNTNTPSAPATPNQDGDVAVGLFTNTLAGGSPTVNSPFTSLGIQQAGAYQYASASYRVLGDGTAGVLQTATETTPAVNTWKGILYLFKKSEPPPFTRVGMTVPISAFSTLSGCTNPFAAGKTQPQADAWVMSMVNRGIPIGGDLYPPVTKRFWFPVNGSNFNYAQSNNYMNGYKSHGTYVIVCIFPAVDGVKGDTGAGDWAKANPGGRYTDSGSPVQARALSDLDAIHQFLVDMAAAGWNSDDCELVAYQEPKNTLIIEQWNMMLRTYGAAINGPDAPMAADGKHFKLCVNLNGASMSLIPTWAKAALGHGAAPWGTSPCKDGLPTIDLLAVDYYHNNSASNPCLAVDSAGDSITSLADEFGLNLAFNEVGTNPGLDPLPPKHNTMTESVEFMRGIHDWYMERIAAGKRPRHINWWTANCYADGTGQVSSPIGLTPMFGSNPSSDLRIGEFQRWYDDFGDNQNDLPEWYVPAIWGAGQVQVIDADENGRVVYGSDTQGPGTSTTIPPFDFNQIRGRGVGVVNAYREFADVKWSSLEPGAAYGLTTGGLLYSPDPVNDEPWSLFCSDTVNVWGCGNGVQDGDAIPVDSRLRIVGGVIVDDSTASSPGPYLWVATYKNGIRRGNNVAQSGSITFDKVATMDSAVPGNNHYCAALEQDATNRSMIYAGTIQHTDGTYGGLYRCNAARTTGTPDFAHCTAGGLSVKSVHAIKVVNGVVYLAAGVDGLWMYDWNAHGDPYTATSGWIKMSSGQSWSGNYWSSLDAWDDGGGVHKIIASASLGAFGVNDSNYTAVVRLTTSGSTRAVTNTEVLSNSSNPAQWANTPPDNKQYWYAVSETYGRMGTTKFHKPEIKSNPANRNHILIAGDCGLWRSTDAGVNWTISNKGHPGFLGRGPTTDPTDPAFFMVGSTDWDWIEINGDPFDGANIRRKPFASGGQAYASAVDPYDGTVWAASSSQKYTNAGGMVGSHSRGSSTWVPAGGTGAFATATGGNVGLGICALRDGTASGYSSSDVKAVVVAVQGNTGTNRGGIYRFTSADGWTQVQAWGSTGTTAYYVPMYNVPGSPDVYALDPKSGYLWVSSDCGKTWNQRVTGLITSEQHSRAISAHPVNRGEVWVAADKKLYRITNAHTGTPATVEKTLPGSRDAGPVGVKPDTGIIYCASLDDGDGCRMWKCTDGLGTNWSEVGKPGSFGRTNFNPERIVFAGDRIWCSGSNVASTFLG